MASAAELRVGELELELARTRSVLDRLNRMGGGETLKVTAMPPLRATPGTEGAATEGADTAERAATSARPAAEPASKKAHTNDANADAETGARGGACATVPGPDEAAGRGWGVCDRAARIMSGLATAKSRHKTLLRCVDGAGASCFQRHHPPHTRPPRASEG